MILFLDADGVLHPQTNYRDELLLCRLPLLEDVLRARPHVDVVVSSTWRSTRTLAELQAIFSDDIAPRIIGMTPDWRAVQVAAASGTYVRQAEIEAWLYAASRGWEQWLAVDDQPHLFRPFCPNLIRTNPETGLTEADCILLAQRLS